PRLQIKIGEALNAGRDLRSDSEVEQLAMDALAYEQLFRDPPLAREKWIALRQKSEKNPDDAPWALLANSRVQDLKGEAPAGSDEAAERTKTINKLFEELPQLARQEPPKAQAFLAIFVRLYDRTTDPEIGKLLTTARELLQQLAQAGKR